MAENSLAVSTLPEKVVVGCASCKGQFRLDSKYAGKTIKCPKCKAAMLVPALPPTPAALMESEELDAVDPIPVASSGYDAGAEDEDERAAPDAKPVEEPAPKPVAPPVASGGSTLGSKTRKLVNTTAHTQSLTASSIGARPMMNRAPTTNVEDPFSRQSVAEDVESSRRPPAIPNTTRLTRPDTRRITPPEGKANKGPMMVLALVGGCVLLLGVVLLVALSGGKPQEGSLARGDSDTPEKPVNPDKPAPISANEKKEQRTQFDEFWKRAGALADQCRVLEEWAAIARGNDEIRPSWETRFGETLKSSRGQAERGGADSKIKAEQLVQVGLWAQRCGRGDDATSILRAALQFDPQNIPALQGLGYRKYAIPATAEFEEMQFDGQLEALTEFVDRWFSPEEYAKVKQRETDIVKQVREVRESWKTNPTLQMAHQAQRNLKQNDFFKNFSFDTFIAEPFVVLLTKDNSRNIRRTWEGRKAEREATLKAIWTYWRKVIDDNGMKSRKEKDSIEHPRPFVWVNFANKTQYQEYLQIVNKQLPAGTRAYYDPKTECVMFYEEEGEGDFELNVQIHETIHQLQDRYTALGVHGFGNHAFREGYPEYIAGFEGKGADLKFGQFHQPARENAIREMRAMFNQDLGVNPGALTKDDWVFFDVPMLMTLRDISFVLSMSQNFLQRAYQNSPYMRNPRCRGYILAPGVGGFHNMFYCEGWAYNYWLATKYPDKYRTYVKYAMGEETGEAESFLKIFGIKPAEPLESLADICGPLNAKLADPRANARAVQVWQDRVRILRATPEIQRLNAEFIAFLKEKFPPADIKQPQPQNPQPVGPEMQKAKADVQRLGQAAVNGDQTAFPELSGLLNRLIQGGTSIDTINDWLKEVGLALTNNGNGQLGLARIR